MAWRIIQGDFLRRRNICKTDRFIEKRDTRISVKLIDFMKKETLKISVKPIDFF